MNGAHCLCLCLWEKKWNRTLRRHKVPIRYRRETQRVEAEYDRCMHKGDAHRNTQYAEELREFGYRWASTGFQFLMLSKWMGEMWRSQANVSLLLCFRVLFFCCCYALLRCRRRCRCWWCCFCSMLVFFLVNRSDVGFSTLDASPHSFHRKFTARMDDGIRLNATVSSIYVFGIGWYVSEKWYSSTLPFSCILFVLALHLAKRWKNSWFFWQNSKKANLFPCISFLFTIRSLLQLIYQTDVKAWFGHLFC